MGVVTVTRSGTFPTTTVKFLIPSWASKPYIFGQFASSIGVNWTLPSGATMAVSLVGVDTTVVPLATTPGTYVKPVGTAVKFAGDYAIDNSGGYTPPGAANDTGFDVLTGGISAATMADPARSIADELPPTCTFQYLEYVITWNASSGTATINYPVFYSPTGAPTLFWLSGQCVALVWRNGPGIRFGSQYFLDPTLGWQSTPEVKGLGFKSTAADWIGYKYAVLQGLVPSSGTVSTELATWFDSTEYSTISDALGTIGVPLPANDGKIRAAIVNGYAECPPLSLFPVGARDPETWLPGISDALETWDFAIEERLLVQAGSSAQIYQPGSPLPITTPISTLGQWKISGHKKAVNNAENVTYLLKDPNGTYGEMTPWHGWFFAGLPTVGGGQPFNVETYKGQHHVVYVYNGNLHYRWSADTGANWQYDTPITDSSAFAGGWSYPEIAMDPLYGRVYLIATHTNQGGGDPLSSGVYQMWTSDDGLTFWPIISTVFTPTLVNMAATQGGIRSDEDGGLLRIVFIPDSGTTGPGTFQGTYKGSGDQLWAGLTTFTLKDTTGTALHSDGSHFGFDNGFELGGRFRLVFVVNGESTFSTWYSGDYPKGQTWTREG